MSAIAVELAFLGHALEGLAGTLNPVLMFVTFGGQQLHNLVATTGPGTSRRAGGKINRLAHMKFVRPRSRFTRGRGCGDTFANGFLG
jgi:hypothetical protein